MTANRNEKKDSVMALDQIFCGEDKKRRAGKQNGMILARRR